MGGDPHSFDVSLSPDHERKLRLAVLAAGELFGGAEQQVLALAQELAADGRPAPVLILFHDCELADRARSAVVTEGHVRSAREKIEQDRVEEVIKTLPTQSKLVLYSIVLLEEQGTETLHQCRLQYKQLCPMVETDYLTHRRITDLIAELDMLGILHTIVVSKGRYGRTKEITLSVYPGKLKATLLQDYRLKVLSNVNVPMQARFGL
jgi:cell division control protein 6